MKKSLFILIFSLFAGMISAQVLKEADVPSVVRKSFSAQYPGSKATLWRKSGEMFEARYADGKLMKGATFTASGDLMELLTEVPVNELPKSITSYMTKNAAGVKIIEAYNRVDISGITFYDVLVSGATYVFDFDGNFVKKNN